LHLATAEIFQHYLYSGFLHVTFTGAGGGWAGGSWHNVVGIGARQLIEQFKRYFIFNSPKPPD
jgi:hypothetical protein